MATEGRGMRSPLRHDTTLRKQAGHKKAKLEHAGPYASSGNSGNIIKVTTSDLAAELTEEIRKQGTR